MSPHTLRLSAAMFALFVALGCSSTLFGLIVPDMSNTLGMSLTYVGLISTLFALGRLVSSFAGGLVADAWGYGPVTAIGVGSMVGGGLVLASAASSPMVLAGAFLMGAGFGAVDVGLNTGIAVLHAQRRGPVLSLLHGFYGVGSFTGPLLLGALIAATSWQRAPVAIAILFVVTGLAFVIFWKAHAPAQKATSVPRASIPQKEQDHSYAGLIRDRVFLLTVAVGFIYLGVSWSLSVWLPTYTASVHRSTSLQGAAAVSALFVGLTVGRFVNTMVIARLGNTMTLLVGSVGSFVSMAVALLAPNYVVMTVALSMTGLSMAALYPVCIAILTQRMPNAAGTVSGAFVTLSTLGVLLIPGSLGMLADRWGIATGLAAGVVALAVLVIITVYLRTLLAAEQKALAS